MELALFFTRNTSLKNWVDSGLFFREKLIYEQHLKQGSLSKIFWITYGVDDLEISNKLKENNQLSRDIIILSPPKILINISRGYLYSILVSFLFFFKLRGVTIFKSNQLDGAWAALISSKLHLKQFYLRTGYTLSLFSKKQSASSLKISFQVLMERLCYYFADITAVSSDGDKKYLQKYISSNIQPNILYNYIDTDTFYDYKKERDDSFVFVGRLNKQKNLFNLLTVIRQLQYKIDIYGDGELKETLALEFASDLIRFKDKIDNNKIPQVLNKSQFYILPSFYEGMPKTLIEAMACGSLCIGTDVAGTNELLDNKKGFLSKLTNQESLEKSIKEAFESQNKEEIIKRATFFIHSNFSLDSVSKKEQGFFLNN